MSRRPSWSQALGDVHGCRAGAWSEMPEKRIGLRLQSACGIPPWGGKAKHPGWETQSLSP